MKRGHEVKALVRGGSEKLPAGATPVLADALRMDSYTEQVRGADTFVHLIGVAAPESSEGEGRVSEDRSGLGTSGVKAARDAGIGHLSI